MPRVYTEVFERLSLQPCVASVKEDFSHFFPVATVIIGSRAAVQLPRPKQTRGCAPLPPITKALTAHIPDPDLSSRPTFLIKNHSRFGLLSFFPLLRFPPSCLAASCSAALQPLQLSSFRYDAIDHVTLYLLLYVTISAEVPSPLFRRC